MCNLIKELPYGINNILKNDEILIKIEQVKWVRNTYDS